MLFARDKLGNLRHFTFDSDEDDLDQVSTREGVLACKMVLFQEGGIFIDESQPILKLIQGGKIL